MLKKLSLIAFSLLLITSSSFALYGARPMGMGQAFTAIADDANAARWNPAGLALNPGVVISGSTMANNRNTWVGDNILNLKMCYEAPTDPFTWIFGVSAASLLAYQGAQYLGDRGILKKGWDRPGEKTVRGESMADQVTSSGEAVSLKQQGQAALSVVGQGVAAGANQAVQAIAPPPRYYYITPWAAPWHRPHHMYYRPWTREIKGPETKAQYALGFSWLNDYNPPQDENANWYTVTVASGFEERVAVGANINIYNLQKISTGTRGLGGDIDLGLIARPVPYISFGLATPGILTTDITWQDGSTTRYEMLVNAGLAIQPVPALTIAADAHNIFQQNSGKTTYHYGAEAAIMPGLLVRAGLSDNSKTAGLSLSVGPLTLDYAYLGGTFNRSQMIGASWIL